MNTDLIISFCFIIALLLLLITFAILDEMKNKKEELTEEQKANRKKSIYGTKQ